MRPGRATNLAPEGVCIYNSICVYIYIYIYIYICIYIYIIICIHTYIHTYIYGRLCGSDTGGDPVALNISLQKVCTFIVLHMCVYIYISFYTCVHLFALLGLTQSTALRLRHWGDPVALQISLQKVSTFIYINR